MMNLFILKRKTRQILKNWNRVKCFKEYAQVKRVLILFDMENAEAVKDFSKSLQFKGKEVLATSYFAGKKQEMPVVPDHFVLWHRGNVGFDGFPKQKELDALFAFKPDTLIDLCVNPNPTIHYISLLVDAEYRVGFHLGEDSVGDLMIEYNPEQGFEFLASQLHFYMKTLRTK
jgi:hypothetical protein